MSNLGIDFDCSEDITEDWSIAPSEQVAYLQACYRRLVLTGLFYDAEYGLGVEGFLLDIASQAEIANAIQTELLKDERTKLVTVTWNNTVATIIITAHTGVTFSLTLAIDAVAQALQLKEI